jgi:ATP-dependent Clp protease ATP-binding subunit ClpB
VRARTFGFTPRELRTRIVRPSGLELMQQLDLSLSPESWENLTVSHGDGRLDPATGTLDARLPAAGASARPLTLDDMGAVHRALGTRLKGQERAIQAVVDTLKLRVVGTAVKARRPVATFLLAGATGTGKTELARATAEALGRRLVRFDMPNFSSREGAWLLVGSPRGPVPSLHGGGQLTAEVRRHPDAVVLLDEVEKADPEVWDPFLRVFDEGILKDQAAGHEVDFSETLIFLTSNLLRDVDSAMPEDALRRRLTETGYFRPELVSRLDRVVLFAPLAPAALRAIIGRILLRLLAGFQARQGLHQLIVQVDAELVDLVLSRCDPQFGARDAERQAERLVGKAVADAFLHPGRTWRDVGRIWLGVDGPDVVVRID